jgi:hypothetical protein
VWIRRARSLPTPDRRLIADIHSPFWLSPHRATAGMHMAAWLLLIWTAASIECDVSHYLSCRFGSVPVDALVKEPGVK